MFSLLLDLLPMILMTVGSWLFYNKVFKKYAAGFGGQYGIRLDQWPLWLMFGTFVLVFVIPYVFHSFDPLNLWLEDGKGRNGSNFSVIVKLILASLPAAGISCWMIQQKTGKWPVSAAAAGITLVGAFALMSFLLLGALLIIVKWLAVAVFGMGVAAATSPSGGGAKYRCSNCQSEVSQGASTCPGCGAQLN